MATLKEAEQAIIDAVADLAPQTGSPRHLRDMAEALAWLRSPSQAHGGGGE